MTRVNFTVHEDLSTFMIRSRVWFRIPDCLKRGYQNSHYIFCHSAFLSSL